MHRYNTLILPRDPFFAHYNNGCVRVYLCVCVCVCVSIDSKEKKGAGKILRIGKSGNALNKSWGEGGHGD